MEKSYIPIYRMTVKTGGAPAPTSYTPILKLIINSFVGIKFSQAAQVITRVIANLL